MYRHRQMQVASHPQTGWTIDQMMNKTFESKGKITPDKSEAKNSSGFFSVLHGTSSFVKIYLFLHVLRPAAQRYEADEISQQRSTRNIINIL